MNFDVRLPLGLMFTLMGALLSAFGLATRSTAIYSVCFGLNVNLGWGLVILAFGLVMFFRGRRGQLQIEEQRPLLASGRK